MTNRARSGTSRSVGSAGAGLAGTGKVILLRAAETSRRELSFSAPDPASFVERILG